MTRLLLIRHAEPNWGAHLPPSKWSLTAAGLAASAELGKYLRDRRVNKIFASNETKAIQTAETAAEIAGITELGVDEGLREHDRDNSPRPSGIDRDSLVIDCIRRPDELIWGNETVSAARDRFGEAIARLATKQDQSEPIAIVSHGTVICSWLGHEIGLDPVPLWKSMGLPWLVEVEYPSPTEILTELRFG